MANEKKDNSIALIPSSDQLAKEDHDVIIQSEHPEEGGENDACYHKSWSGHVQEEEADWEVCYLEISPLLNDKQIQT